MKVIDMTTVQTIRSWLEVGKEKGASHVIVACDTFGHEDYPVYVHPQDDVRKEEAKIKERSMQGVMEVYSLSMDIESQLLEERALHYD